MMHICQLQDVWYMYFGARAPSPQRVHQFRGLTLVLQNFSCLDMTRLKKTLYKRYINVFPTTCVLQRGD